MRTSLKLFGLALALLSAFAMVLIPAAPSYAAAGVPQHFVDILRDPAMLARVKKANPKLYAKIVKQSGDVRVRVSVAELKQLKRLGASEFSSQGRQHISTLELDPKQRQAFAAMEFSSQAKVVVQKTPLQVWIDNLKALSESLGKAAPLVTALTPLLPFAAVIAAGALVIKLVVDAVIGVLEVIDKAQTVVTGKP